MPDTHGPDPEKWFQDWLEACRREATPDLEQFLSRVPQGIRDEIRRLIEDHQALLEAVSDDSERPDFTEGQEIGDYRLIRELGHGGMGAVWEAEQLSLGRKVALKLLAPRLSLSPMLLKRFQREARAGGSLQHPGIVQVFGMGETDGVHWIAQELLPGGRTLGDMLAERREDVELPPGWYFSIAELFAKVADALEHAHQHGVVHRDVKPSNILIGIVDQPRVADFGLARIQDDLGLSRTGDFLGTPFYMSPEQALTKRMGLDHRTDIFSLGATLYEALTLVRAFDGDTSQQVFQKIVTEDPPDPRTIRSRVPGELAIICGKCLEKSPDRRYQSMAELAADLRRYVNDEPILARPPGPVLRAVKWCRRHPVAAASSVVAGLSLIGLSWLLVLLLGAREEVAGLQEELAASRTAREDAVARNRQAFQEAKTREDQLRAELDQLQDELATARDQAGILVEELEARAWLTLGARGSAEDLLERMLAGAGTGAPVLRAGLLQALGTLYLQQERPDRSAEAAEVLVEALALCRRELPEDHPLTLVVLRDLARAWLRQNEPGRARPLLEETLAGRRRILGPGHPGTRRVEEALAAIPAEGAEGE